MCMYMNLCRYLYPNINVCVVEFRDVNHTHLQMPRASIWMLFTVSESVPKKKNMKASSLSPVKREESMVFLHVLEKKIHIVEN